MAAAAASALVVMASTAVFAQSESDITFLPGDSAHGSEPVTISVDQIVGRFDDLDNTQGRGTSTTRITPKQNVPPCGDPSVYEAAVDWGDGSTPDLATVSCDSSEQAQYAVQPSVSHTYKDSGTYQISIAVNDPNADGSEDVEAAQTSEAIVSDRAVSQGAASDLTGTEGGTVTVHATFADSNHAYSNSEGVDPGLTATIDWGDGSTSAGTVAWNDDETNNVMVSGSHGYDANIPATKAYNVKVTLKDDGEEIQATDTLKATIADAALTAGAARTFSATATKASTPTVGTFTDAAAGQAAASDFNATIYWGDSTQSSGSITKTGTGAFSVSGTHTYATTGSKALTIVVSDEEGKTVTLAATASVGAAPVVLPLTGQPHQPALPEVPMWQLALVVLGLCGVAVGVATNRLQRIRH